MEIVRVDLGVCRGYEYAGDAARTAVVLPGAMLGGMPAVWYAMEPLVEQGWRALLVWWEYVDRSQEPWQWVRERADAALAFTGGADLLIGKSRGTHAAPIDVPAVWLTPLLEPEHVEALEARTAPSLFIGGTNDPMWNAAIARELGEVLELDGADHGLARTDQAKPVSAAVASFAATRLSRLPR